jgi:hypothetical protein
MRERLQQNFRNYSPIASGISSYPALVLPNIDLKEISEEEIIADKWPPHCWPRSTNFASTITD